MDASNFYRNNHSTFVISPHGMLAEGALQFSPKKKKIISLLFQRSAFAAAKLLFATAESEYEDIRNFGLKMPVAIIPNGANIPNIKKQICHKRKNCYFTWSFASKKRFRYSNKGMVKN